MSKFHSRGHSCNTRFLGIINSKIDEMGFSSKLNDTTIHNVFLIKMPCIFKIIVDTCLEE